MLLHVDTVNGGVAPMPDTIVERLEALRNEHAQMERPAEVGSTFRPIT